MAQTSLDKASAWSGVWTALITPFKNKSLDVKSLENLINSQIKNGITGLVIAGSTGEGSLMPPEIYSELLKTAQAITDKRIPLVAGLGIGGTESCLKNLALAQKYNYSGVLASPPAYVKAPQRGLKEHFLEIGRQGTPVCLYEVASRAASSIDVVTLKELCESKDPGAKNLLAIKDASGNMDRAKETAQIVKNKMALLSGDDGSFAPFMKLGGNGVVSVVSHLVPRTMKKIFEGNFAEQERINPLIDAIFWESNPVPIKSAMQKLGVIATNDFCQPLVPMREDLLAKLMSLVEKTQDAQ